MRGARTAAALVFASAALSACVSKLSIDGAPCPCPSGYCCNESNVCVQGATCGSTGGTGGGVAGAGGQAGTADTGGAAGTGGAAVGAGGAAGTGGGGAGTGGTAGTGGGGAGTGGTAGTGGGGAGIGGAAGTGGGGAGTGGAAGTGGGGAGTGGAAGTGGGVAGTGGTGATSPDAGTSTDGAVDGGFHSACDPTITDDDSAIHITSASQLASARGSLLLNIFNSATLPNPTLPAANIHLNVSLSTVPAALHNELSGLLGQVSNVGRVDMLEYPMRDAGGNIVFTSLGWHFIPASRSKNKLVIVHQGHDKTLIDPFPGEDAGGLGGRGLATTIDALLFDGYSVLAMYMPQYRPDDAGTPNHAYLMNGVQPQGGGSGTRFFMEPVRAFLWYLETNSTNAGFPRYADFHMIGVSGGGWTTTVYAAIDTTIEHSFPVAGSIPLYLRCPTGGAATYNHDAEQFQGNGIYQIAGYQDLYILGATGTASNGSLRHETQILDRLDDCCFGQAQQAASLGPWDVAVNEYELAVRNAVFEMGQGGMFRVEIDENGTTADGEYHMVGHGEIFRTVLGELDDARRVIGRQAGNSPENDNDAFYRGADGNLWHRSISAAIEENTGIPIVGVPDAAFAAGASAPVFNVVARNLQGAPVIASTHESTGGWSSRTLSGTLNNDPTIVPGQGNSDLWIFGLGTDYLPYVWDSAGNHVPISNTPALGPLSASLRKFEQGFHVFYLAWDRSVVHSYRTNPQAPWQTESLGGTTFGFPSGTVVPSTGELVVFQLGTDGMLYWNRKANGDQTPSNPWSGWQPISVQAGATGRVLMGTPSFSPPSSSGTWTVFVPTTTFDGLGMFTSSSTDAWTFTDLGGNWSSAPTATASGVFTEGNTSGLWQWLSGNFTLIGGLFD